MCDVMIIPLFRNALGIDPGKVACSARRVRRTIDPTRPTPREVKGPLFYIANTCTGLLRFCSNQLTNTMYRTEGSEFLAVFQLDMSPGSSPPSSQKDRLSQPHGSIFLHTLLFAQLVKKFLALCENLPTISGMSHLNPIHTLIPYFDKTDVNVILPRIPRGLSSSHPCFSFLIVPCRIIQLNLDIVTNQNTC